MSRNEHFALGHKLESFAKAEYVPGTTHAQEYEHAFDGQCCEASRNWVHHAGEGVLGVAHGPRGQLIDHVFALHGDHVVDWTHRQFDPTVPVPLVEHKDAYEKRIGGRVGKWEFSDELLGVPTALQKRKATGT